MSHTTEGCAYDKGGMACSRRAEFAVDDESCIQHCCRDHLADMIHGEIPCIVLRLEDEEEA